MKKRLSYLLAIVLCLLPLSAVIPAEAAGNDPYAGFVAQSYDDCAKVNTNGTWEAYAGLISGMWPGDWAVYKNVDFGESQPLMVELVTVTAFDGVGAQLRLDSLTGPVIASFDNISGTDWITRKSHTEKISLEFTGVHDVYLVATSGTTAQYHNIKFSDVLPTRDPYTSFQPWLVDKYHNGSSNALSMGPASLGSMWPGNWVMYERMDFGASGASSVDIYAAVTKDYAGETELRLDSPDGPVIASFKLTPSVDFVTPVLHELEIEHDFTGIHDVYMMSLSGTADYMAMQFHKGISVSAANNAVSYDTETIEVVFSGAVDEKTLSDSCFVMKDSDGRTVATKLTEYDSDNFTAKIGVAEYLSIGEEYALSVSGVKTTDGSSVKSQNITYAATSGGFTLKGIMFTNEAEEKIDKLEGAGAVKVTAELENNSADEKKYTLILVVANENGKPLSINAAELPLTKPSDKIEVSSPEIIFAKGYTAKAFLWETTNGDFVPMITAPASIKY